MSELRRGGHVLIAGVSVRAMAASAAQAGYRVTAVDAFGDADLRALADVVALRRDGRVPFTPLAAARAARTTDADAAAYTANFENYPDAIALLAARRPLLGNAPAVVSRVRSPVALMRMWARLGFAVPTTRASAPSQAQAQARRWLLKPRRSGGGHGTRAWRRGAAIGRNMYVQECISGVPGSIAFAADGRRAVPLALSRQLVGEAEFGARGFRYCGSLVGEPGVPLFEQEDRVREIAAALAETVTAEFGLVGVNGIDFIVRDGVPYPIEVNPRYSASMEVIERKHGISMFEIHARACAGELPRHTPWFRSNGSGNGIHGKAIVFATHNVLLTDTARWMTAGRIGSHYADVPHAGERFGRGHPICTVFARGRNAAACHDALVRRAATVRAHAVITSGSRQRAVVTRGAA